jgi:pimeloyl-ACP methyl ester carboxylesterase
MTDHDAAAESTDISWRLDATTVDGTLVRPPGPGPCPAVVMVAGSGPTDRDWRSPLLPGPNGSARLIAEALAENGFASLRYDKRFVGPHARENWPALMGTLSMQSHADELASAVRTLAGHPSVRDGRIFALGNSEGTLHALNYQVHYPAIPLAGLILIGPPGRSVGAVRRAQLAEQAARIPNGDALLALYDAAIERFLAHEPTSPDPQLPPEVRQELHALENPANLPLARELWTADAASLLAEVDVPVLVLIGKKDVQIDWQADGEPLQRAAAGHTDATFLFPENVNHVFKRETRPRLGLATDEILKNYNSPDGCLDPQAMADVVGWLAAHA